MPGADLNFAGQDLKANIGLPNLDNQAEIKGPNLKIPEVDIKGKDIKNPEINLQIDSNIPETKIDEGTNVILLGFSQFKLFIAYFTFYIYLTPTKNILYI